MARPLRIEYSGAYYHVIQRGMERKEIYLTDKDKAQFLLYVTLAHRSYNIIIHSYALMPNHYHLEVETPEANLSKAMHYINASYAMYYNKKRRRVGPLYQGRYKAIVIDSDEYLHKVSSYVHLNPVKAKLVDYPEQYEWSSYKNFIGKKAGIEGVKVNKILRMFDRKTEGARRLYREYVNEQMKLKDYGYGELGGELRKGIVYNTSLDSDHWLR